MPASTHSFTATAKLQQKKPMSGIVPETQDSHANSHSTYLIPQGQVTHTDSVFKNLQSHLKGSKCVWASCADVMSEMFLSMGHFTASIREWELARRLVHCHGALETTKRTMQIKISPFWYRLLDCLGTMWEKWTPAYPDSSSLSLSIWHSSLAGAMLDLFPHVVFEPTDLNCPTAVFLRYEQKLNLKLLFCDVTVLGSSTKQYFTLNFFLTLDGSFFSIVLHFLK